MPHQICDTFIVDRKLSRLAQECLKTNTSQNVLSMFHQLNGKHAKRSSTFLGENTKVIGSGKVTTLSMLEVLALMMFLEDVLNRSAMMFTGLLSTIFFTQVLNTPDQRGIMTTW